MEFSSDNESVDEPLLAPSGFASIQAETGDSFKIEKEKSDGLGGKNIGTWGSYVYIVNQVFGPGMVALPIVFQQSGWVIPSLVIVFFFVLSSFSATTLIEAIRMIPGNENFQKRVEYANVVEHYYGKKAYYVFQLMLNICLQSINIASIIVCAQSIDSFLIFCFKKTFALELYPHPGFIAGDADALALWGGQNSFMITFTLGYLITIIFYAPWGFFPLDDNIKFQFASFIGLVLMMLEFMYWWFVETDWYPSEVPAFGKDYAQVVGVFITSWAFVMVVPSWVNEKKPHVSINRTVWISCLGSMIGYLIFGIMSALSIQHIQSDNILKRMGDSGFFILTRVVSYIFSMIIIGPGIPVYSISIRYNLFVGGICSKRWSYFWGAVVPWIFAFLFTGSSVFAQLLVWSGLLVTGFVNFVAPLGIYLKAYLDRQKGLKADENAHHLLLASKDKSFPKRVRKYTKAWVIVLLVFISITIGMQIGLSLYYQIGLGISLNGNVN
eukprot:TRINITY_DN1462_c0_g1_i2.p1 TRINITY_DN1462_c0_g1~~TRINITY_DN1462_c0_g1_i2.p1  ORF type:complete len:496 (-),score=101.49 TRINITY_DN1462_c0_g1_i2:89-1576(-)